MYKSKCRYCEKIIEGYSEKQINYMMQQHILAKHQDKIVFPKNTKIFESKMEGEKK